MNENDEKERGISHDKSGTRVFKKACPNGKLTAYLGKRDFIDHGTLCDPVDGVVLIDPEYLREKKYKVFVQIVCAFRYGRDDLDVLGLSFRKDLFSATKQVYPVVEHENQSALTYLQQRLIKKLGSNAHPFYFEIPQNTPSSVTLQPGPNDMVKPCGIDFELKSFMANYPDEKPMKKCCVRLAIRKLSYLPPYPLAPQPNVEVHKEFLMSPAPLHLECSLDREMYYHGEPINVNVQVTNNSNKTIKKIKMAIRQFSDICFFAVGSYKCNVAEIENEAGFPIHPSSTFSKVYTMIPLLINNKDKRGLALDGKLKHEDTNLASSTKYSSNKDIYINVMYKVRVKLIVSLAQDIVIELPFTLTHAKPANSGLTNQSEKQTPQLNVVDVTDEDRHLQKNDGPTIQEENLIDLDDVDIVEPNGYDKITGMKKIDEEPDLSKITNPFLKDMIIAEKQKQNEKEVLLFQKKENDLVTTQNNNVNNRSINYEIKSDNCKSDVKNDEDDDDLTFEKFARIRLMKGQD
ncbi:hypothetical protein SNEBB_000774 [Seison nebaliae]|nr:hypothetical protein SNEBB_000774 [Seison nebaliae]